MEAKTKKKLWIVLAVIVGIFVLTPSIPMIALFALDSSEKSSNQKLEQKISDRDFDGARELANKLGRNEKEKAIERINKAQLSVMVVNNSLEDAQYLAQELDAMPEFFDVLEHNVQKVYERDFRGLYNMLTRFPIIASYHALLSHVCDADLDLANSYIADHNSSSLYKEKYYSTNVGYNDEVGKYNRLVEQVLYLAIFDGDKEKIKKLLPLLKPEAVETKRIKQNDFQGGYNISYKLENAAQANAQRKIKEAGIIL